MPESAALCRRWQASNGRVWTITVGDVWRVQVQVKVLMLRAKVNLGKASRDDAGAGGDILGMDGSVSQ